MKQPAKENMELAAEWLRNYEGEPHGAMCREVADWIEHMATERELRVAAREGGVPVARLRRKLAEQTIT